MGGVDLGDLRFQRGTGPRTASLATRTHRMVECLSGGHEAKGPGGTRDDEPTALG